MGQDYTTATELDPNNRYTVSPTSIAFAGLTRNETAYEVFDFGAGFFNDDLEHTLDFKIDSETSASGVGLVSTYQLGNSLGHINGLTGANIYIAMFTNGTSLTSITLVEQIGSTLQVSDTWSTASFDTTRKYCTVTHDSGAGTVTLKIYSDSARTTLVDTLSITLTQTFSYRYLYGINSLNDGGMQTLTGDVSNLNLGINLNAIEKEIGRGSYRGAGRGL